MRKKFKLYHYLILILSQTVCFAEDGLVYIGDLNKDGINDRIESGPSYLFGAQGQNGPFILNLSVSGKFIKIGLGGTGFWLLERYEKSLRFWDYNHFSAFSGYIGYDQINLVSGEFEKSESILIYAGDNGTEIGNIMYSSIFENVKLERCHCIIVKDYKSPELNENGLEWGK